MLSVATAVHLFSRVPSNCRQTMPDPCEGSGSNRTMLSKIFLSLFVFLGVVFAVPRRVLPENHPPPLPRKTLSVPATGGAVSSGHPSKPNKSLHPPTSLAPAAAKGTLLRFSRGALSSSNVLKTGYDPGIEVVWSTSTGTAVKLKGPFGPKNNARTPPSAGTASDFLKTHHLLFSLKSDLSELCLSRTSESCAAYHVAFQQIFDGIPVEGAKIKVHLLKDGRVQFVTSRLSPHLQPDTRHTISTEQAIEIASRHLSLEGALRGPILAQKVILPEIPQSISAWKVSIPATQPLGDWVVMVHAQTGEILSSTDIRLFATGIGNVFDPNPVVALRTTSLSDQNDSAKAVPHNAYSTVSLEDLDNTGYLRGPYVDTALTSPRAYSEKLDFRYDRSQPGFEEVMLYFHIQQFQNYFRDVLGISPGTRQVLADAHASENDNSWFSPHVRAIYFGDGGVDDAEDAYVILHEYVHAITYDILRDTPQFPEAAAMGEGTCDYFAASFFADRGFQPAVFAQWDGISNTPIGVRHLDSTKIYPADMTGESHGDGEIWSSALWSLTPPSGGVGRETMDKIVAESIHYLDGSCQFADGLQALLLADEALYAGAHSAAISSAFESRGIRLQSPLNIGDTAAGILISGDLTMPDGSYYDQYSFVAVAGQTVKISFTSGEFDAYLILYDPFFNIIAKGDDLPSGNTDALIVLTIPYPGTYHIAANAFARGDTGRYSLTLSAGSASEGTPQTASIPFATQLSGHLGKGDFIRRDDATYYDKYSFAGHVGQKVTISMSSSALDAYLLLYDSDLDLIAQDDDSGPDSDALITYTLPYDGDYYLDANQAVSGPTGSYTLLLSSSDPKIQLGKIVSGRLQDGDLKMTADDTYFDPYQFEGTVGQALSFKMYSAHFDPYLIVYNPYFNSVVEVDDISPTDKNAVFEELHLNVPGTYFVIASAFEVGQTGDYRLAVYPVSAADTDSDGFPDRIEIAESTNPLDPSSVPDDIDGDFVPDTMDPDNDNDHIPNLWELAYGLNPRDAADASADPDLDRMSNLAEFLAGTNPLDPSSFFRILAVAVEAQGLSIRWSSVPGRRYAVHRTTDLIHWTPVAPDLPSEGDLTVWTDQDLQPTAAVFYRVETLPAIP